MIFPIYVHVYINIYYYIDHLTTLGLIKTLAESEGNTNIIYRANSFFVCYNGL